MEKQIKIILVLIIVLSFFVVALVLVNGGSHIKNVDTRIDDEYYGARDQDNGDVEKFVDVSRWATYTSEEYAYEMKYPLTWEFNLTDGTTFNPEICARNKYDECVGRISIAVFPDKDEDDKKVDLQQQCANPSKIQLRNISSDVWMCASQMSADFAAANGYEHKREYYFADNRGSIFEVDLMYTAGEDLGIEEEIIQTIKLMAK